MQAAQFFGKAMWNIIQLIVTGYSLSDHCIKPIVIYFAIKLEQDILAFLSFEPTMMCTETFHACLYTLCDSVSIPFQKGIEITVVATVLSVRGSRQG